MVKLVVIAYLVNISPSIQIIENVPFIGPNATERCETLAQRYRDASAERGVKFQAACVPID